MIWKWINFDFVQFRFNGNILNRFISFFLLVGTESAESVMKQVEENLKGVENQAANAEKYSGLDKGPATYGVVKKLRDNDLELHTDKQVSFSTTLSKLHHIDII